MGGPHGPLLGKVGGPMGPESSYGAPWAFDPPAGWLPRSALEKGFL